MKLFLTPFVALLLCFALIGANAQRGTVTGNKLIGTVVGAPNGKIFSVRSDRGVVEVDATKARYRNSKGRFVTLTSLTSGASVEVTGEMSGSRMIASNVEITSLAVDGTTGRGRTERPNRITEKSSGRRTSGRNEPDNEGSSGDSNRIGSKSRRTSSDSMNKPDEGTSSSSKIGSKSRRTSSDSMKKTDDENSSSSKIGSKSRRTSSDSMNKPDEGNSSSSKIGSKSRRTSRDSGTGTSESESSSSSKIGSKSRRSSSSEKPSGTTSEDKSSSKIGSKSRRSSTSDKPSP